MGNLSQTEKRFINYRNLLGRGILRNTRVGVLFRELESRQRFWYYLAYFELGGYQHCR